MFTIIGGDGREYGPVTADQIRGWVAAGRANMETKAKLLGSEEWRRLGDYPEFGGVAMPPLPPVEPPISAGIPALPVQPAAAPFAAPVAMADPNLADRGARFLARFIDWTLSCLIAIPGAVILGGELIKLFVAAAQGRQPDLADFDVARLILGCSVLAGLWLVLLVIQVWMLTTRGQSIGKRMVKIRIVRLDGSPAGIVHAWLIRELVISVVTSVVAILPLIGSFLQFGFYVTDWCMIFRDDRRCLHDLMASTKVVRA